MKYSDVVAKLDELASSGELKNQTVETVMDTKKYFIHRFDFQSDKVQLKVNRHHYKPLLNHQFIQKIKELKNLVNADAVVEISLEDSTDGKAIGSFFCSPEFLEIVAE